MWQSADLKLQDSTEELTNEIPIIESNPIESVDNPRYIASRQVGVIIKKTPGLPKEDPPRYVATQGDKDANTA